MWEKHCNFPYKTLWIAIVSLHMIFFPYNCFKIIFVYFIFLILS